MKTADERRAAAAVYRRRYRLARYGLTPETFAVLLHGQGGRCAACGTAITSPHAACVDFDHTAGRVRALLCAGCLSAARYLRRDPARARSLAGYLEAFP